MKASTPLIYSRPRAPVAPDRSHDCPTTIAAWAWAGGMGSAINANASSDADREFPVCRIIILPSVRMTFMYSFIVL